MENKYDPKSVEQRLFTEWTKKKIYSFDSSSKKEVFSIDTPPVYPSGQWHIGAVAAYTLIDMAARYKRMAGFEVLFPFCLDRNGINIERTVEKKTGKRLHEFEREEFIELCRKEIEIISKDIIRLAKTIGMSADFNDTYYETDSDEYRKVTQTTFIELWKKGLVYEALRPNIYCPGCHTTISEAEIVYEDVNTTMNYMKWKTDGGEIEIGTTRPELLCACQVVLYNPEDERYKKLKGKFATLPIYNRKIPIYAHPAAKIDFGSGLVMICSYGDMTDVQLFRELKLKPIQAIDEDNKMTSEAGFLKGLRVKEARKTMIEKMKEEGIIFKQEQIIHRSPTCERSGDHLEFINLTEWYIKQLPMLADVKKVSEKMKFYPEKNRQILTNWIDAITIDWPISRRRYYHTEIPIWYCKKCNEIYVPEPGKYYRPWKESPPKGAKCKCGSKEFVGEDRVFDTWVDSSISNMFVCGYSRDDKLFKKSYPCSLRPQGRDIVRTWLYYATLRNYQLTGKPAFRDVLIHGMGLDEHGKKMSKSKGNIISPDTMLEKYGADAFRLWAASETSVGEDYRISEDRISGSTKFLTKLWNVAKFISMFKAKGKAKSAKTDEWILAELNKLIKESKEGYENYNFFIPAVRTREFLWNTFASNYLEMVKKRAYDGDASAIETLNTCLKSMCQILAPICPFITDEIYRELYGKSVHEETFSETVKADAKLTELTEKVAEFNSLVWKTKKEKGLALNAEISGIKIPVELKSFEDDLKRMHQLK
ncbi:MAG: valine--tRNA ligase [Candidatus Aenigmarchaeota archaeon]|nr:valine--tRNA ligase [Candidatus Aenigmarchaeota archaeon]